MAKLKRLHEQYSRDLSRTVALLKLENNLNAEQIIELFKSKEDFVPVSIFRHNLGILETIVKYLVEERNINYSNIAVLLNRDARTIWTAYSKAKAKCKTRLRVKGLEFFIPIALYTNRNFGTLEHTVSYLKEHYKLGFTEIGKLLERDARTVWTVYKRAKNKKWSLKLTSQ